MSDAEAVLGPYAPFLSRSFSEVAADLESFAALLLKWNRTQNLVSRETVGSLWPRHIADSLQILPYLRDTDRTILDLGSGGGFPAIPLAIATKGSGRQLILTEPIAKKTSFLRTVSRELGLGLRVETARAETIADLPPIDLVTSRALASLTELCAILLPVRGNHIRAILHKGREHVEELAESDATYYYDVVVHQSRTDSGGVLIEISNLRKR